MKLLFLDESGDANLHNVDPEYPVFVLGGIIVDEAHYKTEIIPMNFLCTFLLSGFSLTLTKNGLVGKSLRKSETSTKMLF